MTGRVCPDGGACHHECKGAHCFRVQSCGPLSGVYPDDQWPSYLKVVLNGDLPPGAYRARVTDAKPGEYQISQSIQIDEWGTISVITHEMGQ